MNIERGRWLATKEAPYLRAIIFALRFVPDESIPTLGTTESGQVSYNPGLDLTDEETRAVILHETYHLISHHYDRERRGGYDRVIFNVAGDMEINQRIEGLPEWVVTHEKNGLPADLIAEEYYKLLIKNATTITSEGTCNIQPGNGNSDDNIRVEGAIRQAAEDVRKAGNAPSHLQRWAKEILKPYHDPWSELDALSRTILDKHKISTWTRPSRRIPGWKGKRRDRKSYLAAIIDTSGSVSEDDLCHALGILSLASTPIVVAWGDTELQGCEIVQNINEPPTELSGGGGTDMRPIIDDVVAAHPDISGVVVITDGYNFGSWGERMMIPLVLFLTESGNDTLPEWANIIHMELPE